MVAEFESKVIDFRSTPSPSISVQSIELEEAVLGAILLDPGAIAQVENLPLQVFSISSHRKIFRVMLDLHSSALKPDLLTVAFKTNELGILQEIGGKSKLVSLIDRTIWSGSIKQYAQLLQEKYHRRCLQDSCSQIARLAETEADFSQALSQAQKQLEEIHSVTSDTLSSSDTSNRDSASFRRTVTSVTEILEKGLPEWSEQAILDGLQAESGLSKASFANLVAALRCQFDEVLLPDQQRLEQLIDWQNAKIDFSKALPHLASDLVHDAKVLNIDPIMLWQYLLPATLSLVGKKVDLDVNSHRIPAIAWTCSVAESGTGKSRAEGLILSPLKAWQEAEYQRFKSAWTEYEAAKASLAKKDNDSEPVTPPEPERKYLFEVATIQAVMKRLSEQGENGSLWARDEIAGLFKSLGQFSPKGEGEGLECLLPMWDGTSASVDRVQHKDSYYLAASRLSVAGGLQPGVFQKIFQDPEDAQGLQARFLFARPLVQPTKRIKGYCYLSGKLLDFYSWLDTQFPSGTIKLSRAADARYDKIYEQIGIQAEQGETPAIRTWMRKLPGQLLRIALALHLIECYHEPGRPRHELQLDTLNRAVDFCRYYRSTFAVVQSAAAGDDSISSVLLKIRDLALTSPTGLVVRDAYRHIKALQRRAKQSGRSVAAYTIDLYYQLEKMGKGTVQRCGRLVKFVAGTANQESPPLGNPSAVTVVTDAEIQYQQALQVSHLEDLSPVTVPDLEQNVDTSDDIGEAIEASVHRTVAPPDETPQQQCPHTRVFVEPKTTTTHQSINTEQELQKVNPPANFPIAAPDQLQTAQELAALILQCSTWVEVAQRVSENSSSLLAATKTMTPEERRGLPRLLADHLCQDPTYMKRIAWVPVKLRDRALEQLTFTIQRIGGVTANPSDAYLESIEGCKFVTVTNLGTCKEIWTFQTQEGVKLPVFEVEAIQAIAYEATK